MRDPRFRSLVAVASLLCCAILPGARASAQGLRPSRVAPEVRAAVAGGATARVMIVFDVPELSTPRGRGQRGGAEARARIASTRSRILAQVPARGLSVVHAFRHVDAMAAVVDADAVEQLASHPDVKRVDLDIGGRGHLGEAIPLSTIDAARSLGLTGAGITVAIVDSGTDSDHPDLADDLIAEACFCSGGGGCCPSGGSTEIGVGSAEDDHGHGTNVSGIVTGAGTGVGPGAPAAGGAPDAAIVAVKVLDSANLFCCTSDVVAGLDWLIQNRPDVDVVNMSLGTHLLFSGDCDAENGVIGALVSAIDTLHALGVTVFASAGNDGSADSMPAPACASNAISVGAVWDSDLGPRTVAGCTDSTTAADQITCFSNGSTTTDLIAPGAQTTATGIGGATSTFIGTSQASPLAAACAALLLEDDPTLWPDDIEALLEMSPTRVTDAKNGLDYPRLDCHHAITVPEPIAIVSQVGALASVAAVRRLRRPRSETAGSSER